MVFLIRKSRFMKEFTSMILRSIFRLFSFFCEIKAKYLSHCQNKRKPNPWLVGSIQIKVDTIINQANAILRIL